MVNRLDQASNALVDVIENFPHSFRGGKNSVAYFSRLLAGLSEKHPPT